MLKKTACKMNLTPNIFYTHTKKKKQENQIFAKMGAPM